MKRITISLSEETHKDVSELADGLGCSRSALVEVMLSRSLLKRLKARLDFLHMDSHHQPTIKRYRGDSIQEIEALVDYLEINSQGELWDAADLH